MTTPVPTALRNANVFPKDSQEQLGMSAADQFTYSTQDLSTQRTYKYGHSQDIFSIRSHQSKKAAMPSEFRCSMNEEMECRGESQSNLSMLDIYEERESIF
jgi:hypothetical protein